MNSKDMKITKKNSKLRLILHKYKDTIDLIIDLKNYL